MNKDELKTEEELGKTFHILLGCFIVMGILSYGIGFSISDMEITLEMLNYLIPCIVLLAIADTYYNGRIKKDSPKPKIAEEKNGN